MLFGYEKNTESSEAIDFEKNKFVPVICSYDTSGNCIPIYFRYVSNEGDYTTIKVDSIDYCDKNSIFGYRYCCQITMNQTRMQIFLFYHLQTQTWSLRL